MGEKKYEAFNGGHSVSEKKIITIGKETTSSKVVISQININENASLNGFKLYQYVGGIEGSVIDFDFENSQEFASLVDVLNKAVNDLKTNSKGKCDFGAVRGALKKSCEEGNRGELIQTLREDDIIDILQNHTSVISILQDPKILKNLENENYRENIAQVTPEDVISVTKRKEGLAKFKEMMKHETEEGKWQSFFQGNKWIFGLGLEGRLLLPQNKDGGGLKEVRDGKPKVDALLHSDGNSWSTVIAEIKTPQTKIMKGERVRAECFAPAVELIEAVAQVQAYVGKLRNTNPEELKSADGYDTGHKLHRSSVRSYLIIGNLSDNKMNMNDNMMRCFNDFRESLHYPEIITYDELLKRAEYIVNACEKQFGNEKAKGAGNGEKKNDITKKNDGQRL